MDFDTAIERTGEEFVAWVVAKAMHRDCHVIWWPNADGSVQPVFWDLPGDREYREPSLEALPLLRQAN